MKLFFSIKKLNNEYILADEHKLNELIYEFAIDKENNIYFGSKKNVEVLVKKTKFNLLIN